MSLGKIMIVYSDNYMTQVNIPCGQISVFLNVKVSGANGRAIAQAVSRRLPTAAARVRARSGRVGFLVNKVAWGRVFPSTWVSLPILISPTAPHSSSSSSLLFSGTGTIGQLVADVPSGLSLTQPQQIKA
jgi:hypothetical protein